MILGQTIPYLRRKEHFTLADRWGSWVAHQDLVAAALRYGGLEGVHFFLREHLLLNDTSPALEELRREFPGRGVEIKAAWELSALAERHEYVLPVEFVTFPNLTQARQAGRGGLFPVTAIVHATPSQRKVGLYFESLLFAEEFDAIVTTSEAGYRAMRALLEGAGEYMAARLEARAVPKIAVKKIPLGVEEGFLEARERGAARAALGLPAEAVIVLFVGRLTESFKADLEPLLVAFGRLASRDERLHLVVAGSEGREGYAGVISELAGELRLKERLTLKPNFAFSEKPLLYSAADIFVSPVDNVQETFGIAIIEAMASGLPVVASDWSGYRDLVVDGETGFLVETCWSPEAGAFASAAAPLLDPNEAVRVLAQQTVVNVGELYRRLKVLSENEELRRQMGTRGRERVMANFRWSVVMRQYRELWEEQWSVLRSRRGAARPSLPLDFDRVFARYATRAAAPNFVFGPSRLRSADDARINPSRLPPNVRLAEVRRILAECARGPRTVDELRSAGDAGTAGAVTWLWKKGYLERLKPDQP